MRIEDEGVHPDDGTIHAWLDGALSASESEPLAAHVASCASCAERVAEARGLIAGASRVVGMLDDVPMPLVRSAQGGSLWRTLRVTPARASIAAALIVAIGIAMTRSRGAEESTGAPASTANMAVADLGAPAPAAPPEMAQDSVLHSAIVRRLEADRPARTVKGTPGVAMPAAPVATGAASAMNADAAMQVAAGREARKATAETTSARADRLTAQFALPPSVTAAGCYRIERTGGASSDWDGVPLPVTINLGASSTILPPEGGAPIGNWSHGGGDSLTIVLRAATATTSGAFARSGDALVGELTASSGMASAGAAREGVAPRRERSARSTSVPVLARKVTCPRP